MREGYERESLSVKNIGRLRDYWKQNRKLKQMNTVTIVS